MRKADRIGKLGLSVLPEIGICIITYDRPDMLAGLLAALKKQQTDRLFKLSVVVVDNDRDETAREVTKRAVMETSIPIAYVVEPEKNLALARNRSVRVSTGEYVAFIDDDEVPPERWLVTLFQSMRGFGADGVLGPVYPSFRTQPPRWLVESRVAERPSLVSGQEVTWGQTRTGNVLLKRSVFDETGCQFDPAFGSHGEDREFFRRVIARGKRFVWCAEAAVSEIQPVERTTRRYYLKRALLRGSVSWRQTPSVSLLAKTVVAVAVYSLMLPFLALFGQGVFVRYCVKTCDHAGRLLGALGFEVEPVLNARRNHSCKIKDCAN